MLDDYKKFDHRYKRILVYSKDDIKDAETLSKRIKFFKFDMISGLNELEEVVLEAKCASDPIKATKIEDYIPANKSVPALLKHVKWHRDKLENACKELAKLPKGADVTANTKKLKELKKDIDDDLKKRDKKCKLRPNIEKLQKQIDTDLKVSDDILATFKKIPDDYYTADQLYVPAIRNIMTAKPRLSAKTKKFNALAPKMLTKPILQKTLKQCKGEVKAIEALTQRALDDIKEGKTKDGIISWQNATKEYQTLQKTVGDYTEIKKKYQSEIDKSFPKDKQFFEKTVKELEKILTDVTKTWDQASAALKKAPKK